jgi:hypothetical protein
LSKYGTANIRRAYGDWGSATLKGWKSKLHDFAIRPIQQFSYSAGKNATDIALVIDAMELLYTQELDAFCIASSDADFTPLIMQLKANGHDVYGFGARKTPDPFVNACTTFLYLESLEEPGAPVGESARARAAKPAPATQRKQQPTTAAKAPARKLADDEALVTICAARSTPPHGTTAGPRCRPPQRRQAPVVDRSAQLRGQELPAAVRRRWPVRDLPRGRRTSLRRRQEQQGPRPPPVALSLVHVPVHWETRQRPFTAHLVSPQVGTTETSTKARRGGLHAQLTFSKSGSGQLASK